MEKTIQKTDAENQDQPVADKLRRNVVETQDRATKPETHIEKEASYKHESGNPQAEIASDVREHIKQKDHKVDDPDEQVGSDG